MYMGKGTYRSVHNEIALPIQHVRDHHDGVVRCVGKLQRKLSCLYVKGTNSRFSPLNEVRPALQGNVPMLSLDRVPLTTSHICLNREKE